MPTYNFSVELTGIGIGYIEATSLDEAKSKIVKGEWDDIYDHVAIEYGEIIDIAEN